MKKNNLPVLYSFVRCPYAIRARMALVEAKINCVLREVDLKNKPDSMLKISPKGTVPVLFCADGKVIDESLDIVYYALSSNQDYNLDSEKVTSLIKINDSKFIKLLRGYKYPERYTQYSQQYYKEQIEDLFLDKYEKMLNKKEFLLDRKSIADIAILPFIRQFAIVNREWFLNSKYKNLISWLGKIENSHNFKNIVMAKRAPWKESDEAAYLL